MFNELLFLSHIFVVALLILFALRLGKETLTALFCLLVITANLFVVKEIHFFGFTITCTEAMTVGCMLSLNLLQEFWGPKAAKKAIYSSFFLLIFFAIMSQIHLLYRPSPYDNFHDHYATILRYSPRILIASLLVTFISQNFDLYFYGFIKKKFNKRFLFLRNLTSLSLSQALDTILFSYLALQGIVHNIFMIMVISYLVKMLVAITMTPFTLFTKKWVRRDVISV